MKTKALSLRHNFAWNLTGNVVYAGCQWAIVVVLAKVTNTEMVGRFAIGLAVAAPIFLLSQLQLRAVQATDAKDEFTFSHYLGLRIMTTSLAMAAVTLWAVYGYEMETACVIMAVGVSKWFESISDVFYGLMQRYHRMDRIAISRMVKGPLSLLAMGVMVWLTNDILWGTLGLALVWGAILFGFDIRNGIALIAGNASVCTRIAALMKPMFDWPRLVSLVKLTFPLGLISAFTSLQTNIPRYFIEFYCGQDELGIFAALASLIVVGGVVVIAMGQAAIPRLAKYFAEGATMKYRSLVFRLIGFGFVIALTGIILAIFAGRPILQLFYGADYAERQSVLTWLMIGGGMNYIASFCGCGILAARRFKIQLPIIVTSFGCTFAASYICVPEWGLLGGAFALLIGNTIAVFLYAGVLISVLKNSRQGLVIHNGVRRSSVFEKKVY